MTLQVVLGQTYRSTTNKTVLISQHMNADGEWVTDHEEDMDGQPILATVWDTKRVIIEERKISLEDQQINQQVAELRRQLEIQNNGDGNG